MSQVKAVIERESAPRPQEQRKSLRRKILLCVTNDHQATSISSRPVPLTALRGSASTLAPDTAGSSGGTRRLLVRRKLLVAGNSKGHP